MLLVLNNLLMECSLELFMLCLPSIVIILMMNATNAFNSVNRAAALWNARILWPSCSHFFI